MKKENKNASANKINREVQKKKKTDDNEVLEGKDYSIANDKNDEFSYPYDDVKDNQYNNQSEFIDRNSDSKDKS
jgi:hypothetical protein